MVLAPNGHIDRSMEQSQKNISTCLWSTNLQQRRQERKDSLFNKWCLETWTATNKTFPHTIHKNKLKMVEKNIKMEIIKILEDNRQDTF